MITNTNKITYRPCATLLLIYHNSEQNTSGKEFDFEVGPKFLNLHFFYKALSTYSFSFIAQIEKILLAMRSPQTAFAPSQYVFPGGNSDPKADTINRWLPYFEEFGVNKDKTHISSLNGIPLEPKNLLWTEDNTISEDITLRITAIRETFEEVGVLLCIDSQQYIERQESSQRNVEDLSLGEGVIWPNLQIKQHWQKKIHDDPTMFLKLCQKYKLIPDIWSLHKWNIWRSPSLVQKKYDNALYAVILDRKPELLLEETEITNALVNNNNSK